MNKRERQEPEQKLPEYEMEQWILLAEFGNVPEKKLQYDEIIEKSFPFQISGFGDFDLRLRTLEGDYAPDDVELLGKIFEDPTNTQEITVHSPTVRIESILGLVRRYETRMESRLFSPYASWKRHAGGVFELGQYSFSMQLLTPEGIIYTAEEATEIVVVGDYPMLSDSDWKQEPRGNEIIPFFPRNAENYIKSLQIRVTQASPLGT